jgi:CubicO group peptidase (beta-lactamase class C family)
MLPTDYPEMDEWLKRLGALPLLAQPGERWMYQVSGDVLGALIARVSGKSLGEFMQERIFGPLGMGDTSFQLPSSNADRLPEFYAFDREHQQFRVVDGREGSAWLPNPGFESGGGGLLSTIDDFYRFYRMLLDKGVLDNERILSRASVELMTADALLPAHRKGDEVFFGTHSSWGLGVAVDIDRHEIYHNPGRFGWTGGFGTTAYADPKEDMIGILFTQRMMDSPEPPKIFTDFWTLAYGAME